MLEALEVNHIWDTKYFAWEYKSVSNDALSRDKQGVVVLVALLTLTRVRKFGVMKGRGVGGGGRGSPEEYFITKSV